MNNQKYDVFLSRKKEDAHFAKEIYDYLTKNGLKVFDSDHTLVEIGNTDYSREIDIALTNSENLIVVCSSVDKIASDWVESEWRYFLNRKRSGKVKGNLLTVMTIENSIDDLPPSLQNYEVVFIKDYYLQKIQKYISQNEHLKTENKNSVEELKKNKAQEYFEDGQDLFEKKSYTEAYFKFLQSSEFEHPSAIRNIGLLFYHGLGVKQNFETAKVWLEKAISLKDIPALCSLGILYLNGEGVTKDVSRAFFYFESASNQGNLDAEFNIGLLYQQGIGVQRDYKKAIEIFTNLAEKNYPDAQHQLGFTYKEGLGVPKSDEQALLWFLKAEQNGIIASQVNIANMFHDTESNIHDYKQAFIWYAKAAQRDEPQALGAIALHYFFGLGVTKDKIEAKKWLEKSAKLGNEDAKNLLRIEYGETQGINFLKRLFGS